MAEKTPIPLPIASAIYDTVNESLTRRQLEQALLDIDSEIRLLKSMQQSVTSKSVRRHQFLLMGAKHG
jgi:hypothetical protein